MIKRKPKNIVYGNDIFYKVQKQINAKSLVVGINVVYQTRENLVKRTKLFIALNPKKIAELEDFKIHSFSFLKLLFGSSQGISIYLSLPAYLQGWIPFSYFSSAKKLFKLFKLKSKTDDLKLEFYHFFEHQGQDFCFKELYYYISHLFQSLT